MDGAALASTAVASRAVELPVVELLGPVTTRTARTPAGAAGAARDSPGAG